MSKPDWKDAPPEATNLRIVYWWATDEHCIKAAAEVVEPRPEPLWEYQWSVKMNGEWYVAPIPDGLARPAMLTEAEALEMFDGRREFVRMDWTRRERK